MQSALRSRLFLSLMSRGLVWRIRERSRRRRAALADGVEGAFIAHEGEVLDRACLDPPAWVFEETDELNDFVAEYGFLTRAWREPSCGLADLGLKSTSRF